MNQPAEPQPKPAVERTPEEQAALSLLGRLGGRSGKGDTKRRGNADFYRELVAKRADRAEREKKS